MFCDKKLYKKEEEEGYHIKSLTEYRFYKLYNYTSFFLNTLVID